MALLFDIGSVPTKEGVSTMLKAEVNLLRNLYHEVDHFYRVHAQLLGNDQEKEDAGIDITTLPDNKYRLDHMKDILFALKTFIEGNDPGAIAGILDFVEQVGGMPD